ncbi:MAG: hypothetical protein ACIALR_02375, partial [Blastopirellula sp. JB062]
KHAATATIERQLSQKERGREINDETSRPNPHDLSRLQFVRFDPAHDERDQNSQTRTEHRRQANDAQGDFITLKHLDDDHHKAPKRDDRADPDHKQHNHCQHENSP